MAFALVISMPRANTVLQSDYPYNISARCINRDWFAIPIEKVWEIFCEELTITCDKYSMQIHSFVLMSNHFHLLATTPKSNISDCMQYLIGRTSKRITKSANRINETYAGRYYKCILHEQSYYLNAYKYNYRNPVTAGICKTVQDYSFSTLPMVIGIRKNLIPLVEDLTYYCSPQETLNWLNQKPDSTKIEAARYGFRRQYFQSKKCLRTKKFILGPNDIL